MRYMLDTNLCVEIIRGRGENALKRIKRHKIGEVALSVITFAELEHGVWESASPQRNQQALYCFCAPLELLPFDCDAAEAYGQIRAALENTGQTLGPMDLLIAAHALASSATIVTNNEREFRRVPGLKVVNWL